MKVFCIRRGMLKQLKHVKVGPHTHSRQERTASSTLHNSGQYNKDEQELYKLGTILSASYFRTKPKNRKFQIVGTF